MNGLFLQLDDLGLCIEELSGTNKNENEGDKLNCPQLPESFQAPLLCQLDLNRIVSATEVRLPPLASLTGLVYVTLTGIPTSRYLPLNYLASYLSLMPQLKHLDLEFYIPSDDIARGPINPLNVKQIPLPNLSGIFFQGDSSYLEGLAAQITAPCITIFNVTFLDQPSSTLPHLLGLLTSAAGFRFPITCIKFPGTCVDDSNVTICMASLE